MNAKKLLVGLVTAVTLTLFTGAVYAQPPTAPQEDKSRPSIAHQEEHGGTQEHHEHEHHG